MEKKKKKFSSIMNFKEATQPFLWLFYYAGLSFPYTETVRDNDLTSSSQLKFYRKLFYSLINSVVMISVESILLYMQIMDNSLAKQRSVGIFFAVFDSVFYVSVIGFSIKYNKQMKDFFIQFRDLDHYIITKTHKTIDYQRFHKRTFYMLTFVLLPMIITFIVSKLIPSHLFVGISEHLQIPPVIYTGIIQSQIIFYIVLFNRFIEWFKEWIKYKTSYIIGPPIRDTNARTIEQNLMNIKRYDLNDYTEYRCLKCIHFKLWELSRNFSAVFGWNLLLIIFRNWFSVGFNLYRVFLSVNKFGSNALLARKY